MYQHAVVLEYNNLVNEVALVHQERLPLHVVHQTIAHRFIRNWNQLTVFYILVPVAGVNWIVNLKQERKNG